MNKNSEAFHPLTNDRISVKLKLAALWTSLMFLYVYADYFELKTPGTLEDTMNLKTPVGPTTPGLLIIFSVILIIPSLMIPIAVLLRPKINRWINIIFGSLYALISLLIIVSTFQNEWKAFYVLFNAIEVIIFALIIWQAWKWPKEEISL